jgi:Cu/Ag efflux protein CusF
MTCSNKTTIEKPFGITKFGGMALAIFALTLLAGAAFSAAGVAGGAGIYAPRGRQESRYELRGVVQSVDKSKKRATIKHEKIANLMDAMTMPFLIKDEKALNEMAPGDQIRATLVMTNDGGQWLEKITIIAKGAKKQTSSAVELQPDKSSEVIGEPGGESGNDRLPPPARYDGDATGGYTCSMHLNYRSNKPGKCPRCGMTLISTTPAIEEEFDLQMSASPKTPTPGRPLTLRFAIFNPRTGKKVKEFGLMHGKLFHLFLVSQDMSDFQHIHPRQLSDGSFVIKTSLKRPGLYKVYTDIYPLDGAPQFLQTNISAAGWHGDLVAGQARLTPDSTLTKTVAGVDVTPVNAEALGVDLKALDARPVGDLKVELQPESTRLISGRKITLKYRLTDAATGQPAQDLIPYLGAWGHMLILSEDQTEAIHSHPEETIPEEADLRKARGGPELSFDALFPAPGNYRVWAQFLRGDKLSTVAFDLRVERLR